MQFEMLREQQEENIELKSNLILKPKLKQRQRLLVL